jgi:hypothetical protein
MRIVQNLTRSELDAYVKQPTAKKLRDKVMKDGTYIPAGDKGVAAVYVDSRQKELAAGKAEGQDSVEISADGYALKEQETPMPNMSAEMTVDLEGEMPQIDGVAAVIRE